MAESVVGQGILETMLPPGEEGALARLRQAPQLAPLDDEAREALARRLRWISLPRGSTIFRSETRPTYLYLVESGNVLLMSHSPTLLKSRRTLGPGTLLGYEAVIRGEEYGVVARATTDVGLWAITREQFESLARSYPQLLRLSGAAANGHAGAATERDHAREALGRVELFRDLPSSLLDEVVQRLTLWHVGRGLTVYRAGQPAESLFLVGKGAVELTGQGGAIERKETGAAFGQRALLVDEPRAETARAAEHSELWVLSRSELDTLAARHSALALAVSRAMNELLRLEHERRGVTDVTLGAFSLFTGLGIREQADVSRRLRPMRVGAGEIVMRAGGAPDYLYLLHRGAVQVREPDGAIETLGPGAFFGEMALLSGNPHTFTAQAVKETLLLVLSRDDFEEVLHRYQPLSIYLSRVLGTRLEATNRTTAHGMLDTAPFAALTTGHELAPVRGGRNHVVAVRPVAPPEVSRAARARLAIVMVLLLWLAGISLPSLLLEDVRFNEVPAVQTMRDFIAQNIPRSLQPIP